MNPINPDQLQEVFLKTLEKDRAKHIKPWMVDWSYQKKRSRGNAKYEEGVINEFFAFNGKDDLVKWMNWFNPHYANYLPESLTQPLVEKSKELDKKILAKYGLSYDFETKYDDRIGINNAHDYLFPNLYPSPARNQIKTVLDFGAGYGRVSNLWTQMNSEVTFVGMDAIPSSYCLQHLYYSAVNSDLNDYISDPSGFKFDPKKPGLNHIPTWRADLLPDNSFDLVNCVQVLPELNATIVRHMLKTCHRILKPGGMLYLRDHSIIWKPVHKINVDQFLREHGFALEFSPYIINEKELHGFPRIFRKEIPEAQEAMKYDFKKWKNQVLFDLRSVFKKLKPRK
jgi:SAM-dependent methyltransferase